VRLLLDTHALLWALAEPERLPDTVVRLIEDPATVVYASAASTWELAIKAALGKLEADLDDLVAETRVTGFAELRVSFAHTVRVRALPPHHRDPFDRLLVAQAIEEGLTLITRDPAFAAYPAPLLWE
jgi:PIN domain nuclease of toxin-antitoxin system